MEFVHLHNHSEFSLLDGASSIKGMVARAEELGMQHLAITDHGNMFGILEFYMACKKKNINPIIGSEFYMTSGSRFEKSGTETGNKYYHLVLLAKNMKGYQNLVMLSSLSFTEGFYYKPRIDREILEKFCSDLICLSACLAGEIPALILNGKPVEAEKSALYFQNLFGKENFYLELQDHGIPEQKTVNQALKAMSRKLDIPLVITNDSHYLRRDDADAHDTLLCIGTQRKKDEEKRMRFFGDNFYIKSGEEMAALVPDCLEACENTVKIASRCQLDFKLPGPILPDYTIPEGFAGPPEYLRHLTYQGLEERYSKLTEEIKKRADYELKMIIDMGFTGYFLIVWDFIFYARKNGIPVGPGRGSGAGSIVAYALTITDIDPLKYGLLFERFLNPERVSMPDFDIDFCNARRKEVIEYVSQKYGKEQVGQIITFGTLKAKAAVKDVARVFDIPFAEANEIAKQIPEIPKVKLKEALETEEGLKKLYEQGGKYKRIFDTALKLEGLCRNTSLHAAGVVIGKTALTDYVPLYRDAKTGIVATQFHKDLIEDCGLVKMDFLGLKTLDVIFNTQNIVRQQKPDFDIEKISETDKKTFTMLSKGNSSCVFQFESGGMQKILKEAAPNSIQDLIALNALYRPGPMDNIPQFVDCKHGRKAIKYPHPDLEDVLKETYGVIVYQEQVMKIAQIIAGFSLGGADILRRIMGKKKVDLLPAQKDKFLEGATKLGRDQANAQAIFELLIPFAGYGFNKSHAAAYSVLAYQTAYLKAHFPAEFMAANLSNEINDTDKLAEYITECRKMGIVIRPPNINLSDKYFTVVDGEIIYSLMAVKNVGEAAVDDILTAREQGGAFSSFENFLERVNLKVVNRRLLETGIQCGIFDTLDQNRPTLLHNLEQILGIVASRKEQLESGQQSLFEDFKEEIDPDFEYEVISDWPQDQKLAVEKEYLGFYVSGHPLDKYQKIWKKAVNIDVSRLERAREGKEYSLFGLLKNLRFIESRNGRMLVAEIEDFKGSIAIVIFSRDLARVPEHFLEEGAILGMQGKYSAKRGQPQIIVNKVLSPEEVERTEASEIHLRLADFNWDKEELYRLRSFLLENRGKACVFLHLNDPEAKKEIIMRVNSQVKVATTKDILLELKNHRYIEEVWSE